MLFKPHLAKAALLSVSFTFASCQTSEFFQNPPNLLSNSSRETTEKSQTLLENTTQREVFSLSAAVSQPGPNVSFDKGFKKSIAAATNSDPKVYVARSELISQKSRIGAAKAQLNYQLSGTVYGGLEDVTDETSGVAAVLSASKLLYDGGQIDNAISAEEYGLQAAQESYRAILNESALSVSKSWVELERYQDLSELISGRLAVLDPLIEQLERIAQAGVGDATQVAAAQRTVTMIRIAEADVQERLAQSKLNFTRIFGGLPSGVTFDGASISSAVPKKLSEQHGINSPTLMANYALYLSALKNLDSITSKDSVSVGLEAKLQKPFGGSSYDSDESIGIVMRKTLYDGDKLSSEIDGANAMVARQEAVLRQAYRNGKEVMETAMQTIEAMDKAIIMAQSNAEAVSEEVSLLKKQLVIGQSSLESVLSAEARRYDAEAKKIHFAADKRIAQLTVLSAIGSLSESVGLNIISITN
jgi:outer membrane protein TolC